MSRIEQLETSLTEGSGYIIEGFEIKRVTMTVGSWWLLLARATSTAGSQEKPKQGDELG